MIPGYEAAFETLGLERDADQKTIRRAYLKLIKKHKPDADPEGFQRVREAYEILRQERRAPAPAPAARPPLPQTPSKATDEEVQEAPAFPAFAEAEPTEADPTESDEYDDEEAPLVFDPMWTHLAETIEGSLARDQPGDLLAALENPDFDAYDDYHPFKQRLIIMAAASTVWTAPRVFDTLYARYSHVIDAANDAVAYNDLLARQSLNRSWLGLLNFREPPRELVRLIGLAGSLSPESGVEVASEFLEVYDRKPALVHRIFQKAADLEPRLCSYMLHSIEHARWRACDWELVEDAGEPEDPIDEEDLHPETMAPLLDGWAHMEAPSYVGAIFLVVVMVFATASEPESPRGYLALVLALLHLFSLLRGFWWAGAPRWVLSKKRWKRHAMQYCVRHGISPHVLVEAMKKSPNKLLEFRAAYLENDERLELEYEVARLRRVVWLYYDAKRFGGRG